jgi:hypothetical protein
MRIGAASLVIRGTGANGFSRLSDTNRCCSAFAAVSLGGLFGEPELGFGISEVGSAAPDVASTGGEVAARSGLRAGNLIGCTADAVIEGRVGSTAAGAGRAAADTDAALTIGCPIGSVIRQTTG